jgi:hypothetical protein
LVVATLTANVSGAGADLTDTVKPGAGVVNGTPEAVVVVGRSGTVASWSGGGAGGGSGRTWTCGYYGVAPSVGPSDAVKPDWAAGPVDPTPGEVYVLACFDAGALVQSRILRFDPGDPLGGIAAAERARDEARRSLDLPLPRPALNPPGAQLVGVPTWLWLEGAWGPASASASIGAVSSTVTASPVSATWEMGDGTTVTCDAGVPYDPARPADAQASPCRHTFTTASRYAEGGTFPVTVTVTYAVSWTATTGAGGPLEGVSRSTTVPVVVQEAQAVIR